MKKRPNILLLMTDEQRFDAVGYRNPEVHTPNLDRLAQESVQFTNAYATNPSCIPARAAIFTGRYPSQCGAPTYMTPLPKNEVTFMSLLRAGGYHTAVVGKQHFWRYEGDKGYDWADIIDEHFPPELISRELDESEFGLPQNLTVSDRVSSYVEFLADSGFTRGDQLYRRLSDKGIYEFFADERYYVDSYVGDRGLQWLQQDCPKNAPWFLTLSFPGPHMPFDGIGLPDAAQYRGEELALPDSSAADLLGKPPHYLDILKKFGQVKLGDPRQPGGLTPQEIRSMKLAYYADITLIDRKIGAVLELLKEKGLYDDTLILFTSDHGDFMGDFGVATKAQYLAEALVRIPFLLKPPAAGYPGRTEASFVSSVEIAATCLTAAGLAVPANMQQRSLTDFYTRPRPERWSEVYFEARDLRGLRGERYKLVYYAGRQYGEFYDLQADPGERYNLWEAPQVQAEKRRMLDRLLDRMISLGEYVQTEWHPTAPPI